MNNDFFLDAFNALSGSEFEELPVEIEEFVTSDRFLNLPPLSDVQYKIIRAGSQIYKLETLISLYGETKGRKRYEETYNEIILQLGKGSGKDYMSTIICSYVVYLLLCLKDPSRYYGKPSGDTIDIVNIAVNADQAKNVFFANFVKRIKSCPWFIDKFVDKNYSIEFDKSIRAFSGHSQREAFEGLNLILAVLDEIAAFELESNTGNERADTAHATYETYRLSVDSRFSDFGKVYMLSFPRFKQDYIQQAYERVIAEKEVVLRKRTLKLDPDLPDGTHGNEFDVEWEEDHILRYKYPRIFALRRPTWEVNPTVRLEDPGIVRQFHENRGTALGKLACMPSNLAEGFFKNVNAIDATFTMMNGVDETGVFLETFQPEDDTKYYVHVDLAQKQDHCAVALAHVDKWINLKVGEYQEMLPQIRVDAVRWWTPTATESVNFSDVKEYIIALRRRGFNIGLVTFDRWNSHDIINTLKNEYGIESETLSVGLKHYQDFQITMYEGRVVGPDIELLKDELKELREEKNKVEHPRKGSKDLSDAVCGAIFNAIAYTDKPQDFEVEVVDFATAARRVQNEPVSRKHKGVISAPKPKMPSELQDFMSRLKIL